MTQDLPQDGSAPAGRANWGRVLKVCALLVASMTIGALACWSAMRAALPEVPASPAVGRTFLGSDRLAALIWPEDMPRARDWGYVVIHHSGTRSATVEAIRRYHTGIGFEGVGYHFVINNGVAEGTRDGQITPTRRWLEQRPGAHARIVHHPEYNREGIGICLVGNFEKTPPTTKQMVALERLVLLLRRRYGIPLENIVGHRELKNTKCPGRLFPMEAFLMDLRKASIRRHLEGGA